MSAVFVLGLFRPLQRKFDSDCVRQGLRNSKVLADIGAKGTLTLLPIESDAVHAFRAYLDSLDDYHDAHVVVLPYAPIPANLEIELKAIVECGGTVIRGEDGKDGWPQLAPKKRPDTALINAAYVRLWQGMPVLAAVTQTLPSEYFRQVVDGNSQILIADEVYDTCDLVAAHRHDFLKRAIDALVEFVADGSGGRIDAFFRERALEHAQTGGITATLELSCGGEQVLKNSTNTHLKQGDKTTPEGAARMYYHHFAFKERTYVAVLYAGPHPDRDVRRSYNLPQNQSH
jgi:hypothetical protein